MHCYCLEKLKTEHIRVALIMTAPKLLAAMVLKLLVKGRTWLGCNECVSRTDFAPRLELKGQTPRSNRAAHLPKGMEAACCPLRATNLKKGYPV